MEFTMTINDGRDDYNLRGIPYSYDEDSLPREALVTVRKAVKVDGRKEEWEAFIREYPEKLENDRIFYGSAVVASLPLTVVWGAAVLALLGSALAFGLGPTLLGSMFLLLPFWFGVFCVTTVVHAVRFRQRRNPVSRAMEQASRDVMLWAPISLVFPFYALPKFTVGALEAFVSSPTPIAEDKEAEAIRLMKDARLIVGVALHADIVRMNTLAGLLKSELASRALKRGSAVSPKVNIEELQDLLRGLRHEIERKIVYLGATYDEKVPFGEFTADVEDLLAEAERKSARADVILSTGENRRAAILELARY